MLGIGAAPAPGAVPAPPIWRAIRISELSERPGAPVHAGWRAAGQEGGDVLHLCAASSPIYELSGVTKNYHKGRSTVAALRGVDLVVEDGEWLAVQGPTGHGKSTLLQILGGLDRPISGSSTIPTPSPPTPVPSTSPAPAHRRAGTGPSRGTPALVPGRAGLPATGPRRSHDPWLSPAGKRCRRMVQGMLLWINGPFGGGKTHAAHEIQRPHPGSVVCDPEHLGIGLRRMMPRQLRGNFQDIPAWRQGTSQVLDAVLGRHDGDVIVPMTVIEPAYLQEIVGPLRANGHQVRHYSEAMLDQCLDRLSHDDFAEHIRTDELTIAQVADRIAASAGLTLTPDDNGFLRAYVRRTWVTIKHIRIVLTRFRSPAKQRLPDVPVPGIRQRGRGLSCRLVCELHDSFRKGLCGNEPQVGVVALAEEHPAVPGEDGVDRDVEHVDQVLLQQGLREKTMAPDEKVSPFLLLELGRFSGHVAPDNRRVVPACILQRGREDILEHGVEPDGPRVGPGWVDLRQDLVRAPAHQHRLARQQLA